MAISTLTSLGMTDYEARAYWELLRESPLTAYEIAKNSGIPSSKVYEVMKRLESRHIVNPIQGEKAKMFMPTPPKEFIESYRSLVEQKLDAASRELTRVAPVRPAGFTVQMYDYESLLLKAKRALSTAARYILLSVWPQEFSELSGFVMEAEDRGVQAAVVHYGPTNLKAGTIYRHPVDETVFKKYGTRNFVLASDSREAIIGSILDEGSESIWSMNKGFVLIAEDYVKHDIYLMKMTARFDPLLRETYGLRYEKLQEVFSAGDEH